MCSICPTMNRSQAVGGNIMWKGLIQVVCAMLVATAPAFAQSAKKKKVAPPDPSEIMEIIGGRWVERMPDGRRYLTEFTETMMIDHYIDSKCSEIPPVARNRVTYKKDGESKVVVTYVPSGRTMLS